MAGNGNNSSSGARSESGNGSTSQGQQGGASPHDIYKMVSITELPAVWQVHSTEAQLLHAAGQLGFGRAEEHKVFLVPQVSWVLPYVQWTYTQSSTGRVGVVVQARETWTASAAPGALSRLRRSLANEGHPGFENLGRLFVEAPGADSGNDSAGLGKR